MQKTKTFSLGVFLIFLFVLVTPAFAVPGEGRNKGFVHAMVIPVDGENYYLAGAPDGPNGATDIPGHEWVLVGRKMLVGKHYIYGAFWGSPVVVVRRPRWQTTLYRHCPKRYLE